MSTKEEQCQRFCEVYGIDKPEELLRLYEVDELMCFMPATPSEAEKKALQELVGLRWDDPYYGYMDYHKSNNTFELIMQWREKTQNWG
ncbi:MAG: hypothetical protein JJT94_02965 [Bernardetiaceae bacterium]|nr:hypothetical protein [Bernardetiaceae bacterium]